jgi:serine/threonine protein kinase
VFARKIIRLCGYATTDDIENEANAVAILCSRRESKYVVEVLQHGWLTNANIHYFIDMEYCPETLEDRLHGWKRKQQSDHLATPQVLSSTTERQTVVSDEDLEQTAEREVVSEVDTERAAPSDIDWHPVLTIFLDITKGLRYIHSKGFVHRALKPKNGMTSITNFENLKSSPIFPSR